ncbi:MAG: glutamate-cysteine ligase family protein [Candidatus Gastranaerophilales bacterium]|nr:glutamate-cysteine ligase family protein [Candidatus Gastranaerophilales bacterium]
MAIPIIESQISDKITAPKSFHDNAQLLEIFYSGCSKNKRLGVEFEKLGVTSDYKAASFDKISNILKNYSEKENFVTLKENNKLLGLKMPNGIISLEPGAQFEVSFNPFDTVEEIETELVNYNKITSQSAHENGVTFIGYGMQPLSCFEEIKIIPKKRYEFMTKYLPSAGLLPFVMMRETAGVQVSVDYESQEDAVKKLACALRLAPFFSALFSNSPIRGGRLNNHKSYRAKAWLNTDNKRCGLVSKKLFSSYEEFTFQDYAEILLDVPMILLRDKYVGDMTFREYMSQNQIDIEDWYTHLSLFFPDVRLKSYIEIRNHDSQRPELLPAIPALYKGILYNEDCMDAVFKLFEDFSYFDFEYIRHNAPLLGMDFDIRSKRLNLWIEALVDIAQSGLKSFGKGEEKYLEPIYALLKQDKTPADIIIEKFEGTWKGKLSNLIEYSRL